MKKIAPFLSLCLSVLIAGNIHAASAESGDTTAETVKSYLVKTIAKMKDASADFVKNSEAYEALIKENGGTPAAAYQGKPKEIDALIAKMQENYKAMDSYGYETVEGIVAGVGSMVKYDVYLDSGVPKSEGPENVAPVVLTLDNGKKIDHEGALFTYIIEPALWSGDKRWIVSVDGGKKYLPRPEVLVAAAKETDKSIGQLQSDALAWKASKADCFNAMVVMTPTFSDYFDDWKESLSGKSEVKHFQAVSRVSDMRGIMGSCKVMYDAVKADVAEKDKALAKSTDMGFKDIMRFIDLIEKREKQGNLKTAEIDEMATQAKQKTDKVVPQVEQGATLTGVKVSS